MRIIAGNWRGRKLAAPKGQGTRPTTDRVRESLMSSLASARGGFEGAMVLDAFAGSGALGFEALSRGAEAAWFCEADAGAFRTLQRNAQALGTARPAAVLRRGDVLARPPLHPPRPFDLVLLDPPYAAPFADVLGMLDALAAAGALADGALVSYEHAKADNLATALAAASVSWEPLSHKTYGETAVDVLRAGAPARAAGGSRPPGEDQGEAAGGLAAIGGAPFAPQGTGCPGKEKEQEGTGL